MDPIEDLRRHYHPFRLIRVKRACGADAQTFGKLCFRKFLSFLLVRKDSVSLARCRVSSFGSNETYHVSVDRLTRGLGWGRPVAIFIGQYSLDFCFRPKRRLFFASFRRSVFVLFPCRQSAAQCHY
jgi:hypothetical protein